jgi:23S rRNA-/tRNA-specific pseudouridylate synthase
LLGTVAWRLPVLAAQNGIVALGKPSGIAWGSESGERNVVGALRRQLAEGKPELLALGLQNPVSAWPLDAATAGIGILASRGACHERWRNAFGSEQFCFRFEFLAEEATPNVPDVFECTLPIAQHLSEPRALISHSTGKKSRTIFRRISRVGRWSWWEASAHYLRQDQVRLHAAECQLRIVGETSYPGAPSILLEQLIRRGRLNKGEAKPLHDEPCLRMSAVDCSAMGAEAWGALSFPESAKWGVLRRRLDAFCKNSQPARAQKA